MTGITLLYGTGNPAKLEYMRRAVEPIGIRLLGLCDMPIRPPGVDECGKSPLDNARIKAKAYHEFYRMPVFSCDSGLYFDNVPDEVQPGVNVRRVNGRSLTDDEMTEYYSGLVKKFGRLTARYRNAVCLVLEDGSVVESMDDSLSGYPFFLTDVPHPKKVEGFPLDRISLHIGTGKYYYDLSPEERGAAEDSTDGWLRFFTKALKI